MRVTKDNDLELKLTVNKPFNRRQTVTTLQSRFARLNFHLQAFLLLSRGTETYLQ